MSATNSSKLSSGISVLGEEIIAKVVLGPPLLLTSNSNFLTATDFSTSALGDC